MEDEELFAAFAERLREAHERVRALTVDEAEKASVSRRILVISDAAKHDLGRANLRLLDLLEELDRRQRRA